ncbi:MAG: deoxyhypusine synthase family protein [Chloroflexota bacterium]|nr:deoxyhypusine synthase family protein [Chloroflexota bacterium]
MAGPLHTPVAPFPVSAPVSSAELVQRMAGTSFQARNLAQGVQIWERMLRGEVTIFFGLAGAMVPAGMRRVMVYLIENRLIDCLVSTGANLYHDLHESLGYHHWQGASDADDRKLEKHNNNRIYDLLAPQADFIASDEYITRFSRTLEDGYAYTTREYFYLLGLRLREDSHQEGILTAAAKARIPIYCPALGDSVFGFAIAAGRVKGENHLTFDIVRDVIEMTRIVAESKATGVVYVGGGTPKNFIQQTEVAGYILGRELGGHRYAVQITTDTPQWGGLSGCTFDEARSWGKLTSQAPAVTVHCDATIALPLMVSALAETQGATMGRRKKPSFVLDRELKITPPSAR